MKRIIFILTLFLSMFLHADSGNGWQPLHEAVYSGDMAKMKKIVGQKSCDLDAQSKAGISPLHIAVKVRNLKMVNYLLDHGADVDIQDNNGYTPLLYAVSQHRMKIVRSLIRHDADANLANSAGITPLQQAAYSNDFQIVDFLLRNGADPELKNLNGVNACELAYVKGNFAMAEHLKPFTRGECGIYLNELKKEGKK
ncbi:ankyrin repeat domain-containing protein [Hydrogenimonas sp.]